MAQLDACEGEWASTIAGASPADSINKLEAPASDDTLTARWMLLEGASLHRSAYSIDEIKEVVRTGSLRPNDRVLRIGYPKWTWAGDVPEFKRYFALKKYLEDRALAGE